MNDTIFEIDGKTVTVNSLCIENTNDKLTVKMQFVTENDKSYSFTFQNVSKLNIEDICYPFEICGFEVLDFSSRGYQKECRFFVNDYEHGTLSFYCESIE